MHILDRCFQLLAVIAPNLWHGDSWREHQSVAAYPRARVPALGRRLSPLEARGLLEIGQWARCCQMLCSDFGSAMQGSAFVLQKVEPERQTDFGFSPLWLVESCSAPCLPISRALSSLLPASRSTPQPFVASLDGRCSKVQALSG